MHKRSLGIPSIPPQLAAVISKAVKPRQPQNKKKKKDGSLELSQMASDHKKISHCRAVRTLENTMALKLLPDIARALNIRISSILSPSGIMENNITVNNTSEDIDSVLKSSLSKVVLDYLEKDYKLNFKTRKMLMQILGTHGTYATLIVPESAIDQIINGSGQYSMESLSRAKESLFVTTDNIELPRSVGLLKNRAPKSGYSAESHGQQLYNPEITISHDDFEQIYKKVSSTYSREAGFRDDIKTVIKTNLFKKLNEKEKLVIVDNPELLKLSSISKNTAIEQNKKVVQAHKHPTMDAHLISRAIFGKQKAVDHNPIFSIPAAHTLRATYGSPMVKQIPAGSILNIIQPGCPEEPIGHMIMLDVEGYPIDDIKNVTDISSQPGKNKQLIELVGTQYYNDVYQHHSNVIDFARNMYIEVVEREVVERVRTGLGMTTAQLIHNSGFYDVMMARHLAGQYTQLLYVPREYLSYMAFDYDDDGLGKSLLDSQRVINSMRVVLAHNDVLSSIRNSTGTTTVEVNIDENDPDPDGALELIQDNIIRSQMFDFGNALINSGDTIYHLQRMGYQWNVNNHPSLPDTKATYSRESGNAPKSDEQLNEYLRKASHYNIGVPPEMVDNSENAEFATQSVIQNTLFGKQAIQDQQIFSGHLTGLAKRLVVFNGDINNKLYEQILKFIVTKINEINTASLDQEDTKAKEIDIDSDKTFDIADKALPKVLDWLFTSLKDKTSLSNTKENVNLAIVELAKIIYSDFIENMIIELPKPPSVTLESQMQDYSNYVQFCDDILNAIFADEVFDSELMQADIKPSFIRATVKSRLLADYLADKAIMPEFTDIISLDENRNPDNENLNISIAHAEYAAKAYLYAKQKLGVIGKTITAIGKDGEKQTEGDDIESAYESLKPGAATQSCNPSGTLIDDRDTTIDDRDVVDSGSNNNITIVTGDAAVPKKATPRLV